MKTIRTQTLLNGIKIDVCRCDADSQLKVQVLSPDNTTIGYYGLDDVDSILNAIASKYSLWSQEQIEEASGHTKTETLPNGLIVELYRGTGKYMSSSYFVHVLTRDGERLNCSSNKYRESAEQLFQEWARKYSKWTQLGIQRKVKWWKKSRTDDWMI